MNRRQFGALMAASGALGSSRAAESWRLASGYRSDVFHSVNLMSMAGELNAATQGRLKIEIHPDNSLVKLNEIFEATRVGKIQAGEVLMSSFAGLIPVAGADSVPFITHSYADARRMWALQKPILERHFDKLGLKLLYAVPWPPQGLFTSKSVSSVADFKGSRMRSYNATTVRIAESIGAKSVPVPASEIKAALADKRIDSMITSTVSGVENQVWSHLRYYYEINAWFPKNAVFANAAAVQALDESDRQSLMLVSTTAEDRGWTLSESAAFKSLMELQKNGIKIEAAPRNLSIEIKRLGERFSLDWIRSVGREANDIFVPYFKQ
jgi:TRAP-type transport system periplasmic protein